MVINECSDCLRENMIDRLRDRERETVKEVKRKLIGILNYEIKKITRPLRYSTIMTKRRIYLIILFVWTLSLVVSLAPQIGWKSPQNSSKICEVNEDLAYALFSASLSFYIPLAIILIVYYRIFKEARAQSRFLKTGIKTSKASDGLSEVTLR